MQINSKAIDGSDAAKKKESAERVRLHAERKEAIRRRLEQEIPVASPKELSRLWHNSVEILSTHPDGQTSTSLWVLWETSLRLAALAKKHGTPHDNLASIRAVTIGLPGDVSQLSYLFSQEPIVGVRDRASVEISRLLIALPDLGDIHPSTTAADAPTKAPTLRLGNQGPSLVFDALCDCMRRAHPGQGALRAGCRIDLTQAREARDSRGKASEYLSPRGRLCAGGWLRRDGKFIELTVQGADEAARRVAKRLEKQRSDASGNA